MIDTYPETIHGEILFIPKEPIKKCSRCDKYGTVTKTEPGGGTYQPYCLCPFGNFRRAVVLNRPRSHSAR